MTTCLTHKCTAPAWLCYLLLPAAAIAQTGSSAIEVTNNALQQEYVGHWAGRLVCRNQDYPIRVNISKSAAGFAATVDLPDYCLYGCPAELSFQGAELRIVTKLIEAQFLCRFAGRKMIGTAELLDSIRATIEMHRQRPDPVTYVAEELRFHSEGASLVGTLIKPAANGPVPAIIWTHGSGPDTRDLFYYQGRAHLFAQHGVASLIYDKRGAGQSTGSEWWLPAKLADDALAAIKVLKQRPDIDAKHIGIAGFSQGGWVAPQVAARCQDVAFVIVGATPGISTGEQNIFTLQNRLRDAGYKQQIVDEAAGLLRNIYRLYEIGEGREEVAAALSAAKETAWYKEEAFQGMLFIPQGGLPKGRHPYWQPFSPDPMDAWRQVRVPVLSVWGALDRNVPADLSRQRIQSALREAGNNDHELVIFPSASHGLWVVRDEGAPWDWPRQAPGYHDKLMHWVAAHLRTAPREDDR